MEQRRQGLDGDSVRGPTPIRRSAPKPRVQIIDEDAHNRLDMHEARIESLETLFPDIADLVHVVNKIWRTIKWGLPSVVSAAVAAGVVNGKLGAFLGALFH